MRCLFLLNNKEMVMASSESSRLILVLCLCGSNPASSLSTWVKRRLHGISERASLNISQYLLSLLQFLMGYLVGFVVRYL